MKKNMGSADKVIRILLAIGIIALYYANVISGTAAIVGLVVAGIFIATSLISVCPLYMPFGISTCNKK